MRTFGTTETSFEIIRRHKNLPTGDTNSASLTSREEPEDMSGDGFVVGASHHQGEGQLMQEQKMVRWCAELQDGRTT